jgi:hypothetical protein
MITSITSSFRGMARKSTNLAILNNIKYFIDKINED